MPARFIQNPAFIISGSGTIPVPNTIALASVARPSGVNATHSPDTVE
jgi:hypothetical protein